MRNNATNQHKLKITTFEMGYLVILIARVLSITTIHLYRIWEGIEIGGYLLIASNILKKKYSAKRIVLTTTVLLLLVASYYYSHDDLLISILLIGISVKSINYRRLIYYDLIVRAVLIIIVMGLAKIGFLQTLSYTINSIYKTSLGFSHPNHLGGMMFVIAIYWFYLRHKKFRLIDYALLLLTFYCAYSIAGSRTSSYLIALIIGFELFDSFISKLPKIERIKSKLISISKFVVFIIPGVSIWMAYNYRIADPIMSRINSILTGRLYLAYHAARNNPITLFGSFFEYQGGINSRVTDELSNAIDNSYLYILLHLGLIIFILFIISLFVLLKYYQKIDRTAFLCLIIFMVGAFSEATMFDVSHNVFLFAVIPAFTHVLQKNKQRTQKSIIRAGVLR